MKNTPSIIYLSLALVCAFFAQSKAATAAPTSTTSPTLEWIDQIGTSSDEASLGVSADGLGNVYISGNTRGNLGGTNAGSTDAFVSKYDANGTLLWIEQLGTSNWDESFDVSADGLGNVYISGRTKGNLEGINAGDSDAFVSKYDTSGTLLWTEQFGSSSTDISRSVSADGLGNVYISGSTRGNLGGTNAGNGDVFVSKYNANGTLLWIEQFGTSSNEGSIGVSADGLGNVYITGATNGSLGGTNVGYSDAFLSKYDANGTHLWTEQLGTSDSDTSSSVLADGLGNVYISGYTGGNLGGVNAGAYDAFISKYDASGTLLWTEQMGASGGEYSRGVSSDGLGNVYISGQTDGGLGGANAGGRDAFISKYDANGTHLWTEQLGTSSDDGSLGVSADGLGNVYISGNTWGSLEGTNAGRGDVFIAKYNDQVPEPSTLLLCAIACFGFLLKRKR